MSDDLFDQLPPSWRKHADWLLNPRQAGDPLSAEIWAAVSEKPYNLSFIGDDPDCSVRVRESSAGYTVEISAGVYARLRSFYLLASKTKDLWPAEAAHACEESFSFLTSEDLRTELGAIFTSYESSRHLGSVINRMFARLSYDEPAIAERRMAERLTEHAIRFFVGHEIGHIRQGHFAARRQPKDLRLIEHPAEQMVKMLEADADCYGAECSACFITIPIFRIMGHKIISFDKILRAIGKELSIAAFATCGALELIHFMNVRFWPDLYGQVSERAFMATAQLALTVSYHSQNFLQFNLERLAVENIASGNILFRSLLSSHKTEDGHSTSMYSDLTLDETIKRALSVNREVANLRKQMGNLAATQYVPTDDPGDQV
jgi:hypothetical protein